MIIARIVCLLPGLMLLPSGIGWLLNPAETSVGFGFIFNDLSLAAQNALIRDLTAFFLIVPILCLMSVITLNYLWVFSVSILSDWPQNSLTAIASLAAVYILLVKPFYGCSTKEIFAMNKTFSKKQYFFNKKININDRMIVQSKNDLEISAFKKYPKLKTLKNKLL